MKKAAIIVALPLVLGGCAELSPLSVASLALNGVSFASTGQTTSDHLLSAFVDKDCRMLNLLKDEPVCVPFKDGEKGLIAELGDEPYTPNAVSGASETGLDTDTWRTELASLETEADAERLLATAMPVRGNADLRATEIAQTTFERLNLDYQTESQDDAVFTPAALSNAGADDTVRSGDIIEITVERRTHLVTATLPDRETAQLVADTQGKQAKVVKAKEGVATVYRVAHTDVGLRQSDVSPHLNTLAALPKPVADPTSLAASDVSGFSVGSSCMAEVCGAGVLIAQERDMSDQIGDGSPGLALVSFGNNR